MTHQLSLQTFSTHEVTQITGISPATLKRWLRRGIAREPTRDRLGSRRFTDYNIREILLFRNRRIAAGSHPTNKPSLSAK